MSKLITKKILTPFQESLLVLTAIRGQIAKAAKTMVTQKYVEDDDLKFTLSNHIQILLCSFLKEWEIIQATGNDNNIQATLRIVSPALNRIRQWKGLPKVRSMLLAHGHRDNKGEFVLPWDVFDTYNAPNAYAEIILLADCAHLAIDIVLDRHKSDYQETVNKLTKMERGFDVKGIQTIGELKAEFNKIKAKVSRIAREYD